uniref:Uncharacterized protein n=1 Tax=Romanomermis culicivorax TaxID=13658 RepID=A0A915HWK7_ROMCU
MAGLSAIQRLATINFVLDALALETLSLSRGMIKLAKNGTKSIPACREGSIEIPSTTLFFNLKKVYIDCSLYETHKKMAK